MDEKKMSEQEKIYKKVSDFSASVYLGLPENNAAQRFFERASEAAFWAMMSVEMKEEKKDE